MSRWHLGLLLLGLSRGTVSNCATKTRNRTRRTYLLVDEVLIIVLDVEFALHIPDFGALREEVSFHAKHFFASNLTLTHQSNQLPCIFKFFTKSPQLLGTLGIPTTRFADLTNLTSTETDIRIAVISILTSLELQKFNC